MRTSLYRAALLFIVLVAITGCPDEEATSRVIVGVTSDFLAGSDLTDLDVVMTSNGQTIRDERVQLGASAGRVQFPIELIFDEVPDGADLTVTLEAYRSNSLRVVRTVKTQAVAGAARLVRIHIEALCMLTTEEEVMSGAPESAPTCDEAKETCISGRCRDNFIAPSQHEPYTDEWATNFGDPCKPPNADEPIVTVGSGQSDYFKAEDYDLAEVEAGPQGGHHIWIAARIKNLHQSGSITSVGGEFPALGLSITPLKVIFTMDPDEGGFCKLYGLRFQIDIDGDEVETLLGEEVRVIVSVEDSSGDIGTDDLWVTLSDYII